MGDLYLRSSLEVTNFAGALFVRATRVFGSLAGAEDVAIKLGVISARVQIAPNCSPIYEILKMCRYLV